VPQTFHQEENQGRTVISKLKCLSLKYRLCTEIEPRAPVDYAAWIRVRGTVHIYGEERGSARVFCSYFIGNKGISLPVSHEKELGIKITVLLLTMESRANFSEYNR
jgi:hypothetical protein